MSLHSESNESERDDDELKQLVQRWALRSPFVSLSTLEDAEKFILDYARMRDREASHLGLKVLLSQDGFGPDDTLTSLTLSTLDTIELQNLTDEIYAVLTSSNAGPIVTSDIMARIWLSTRALPSQLLVRDVTNVSAHPFAVTASSNVHEGITDSLRMALKTFRSTQAGVPEAAVKRFFFETLISQSLQHPNILPVLGIYSGKSPNIYMASKLLDYGPLPYYLESHPEADRLYLLTKAAKAIAYLHALPDPILHGDVRGMNVLVDGDGQPLLIDLGYSMILDTGTGTFLPAVHMHAGNPRWTAPEKIRPSEYPITLTADSYSFASFMVEVFSGKVPFDHLRNDAAVVIEVLVRQRHPARPTGPYAHQLTDPLWELMQRSWSRDPVSRPSMREVHEFLVSMANAESPRI